jgi:hypothetical protein
MESQGRKKTTRRRCEGSYARAVTVRGTRHASANAIGGRQEMQCRHMLLFARGQLGFDNAVWVVLWVGAAGCQKR